MRPGAKKERDCTFSASKVFLLLLSLAFASFMPYVASGEESSASQTGRNILFDDFYETDCLKYSEVAQFEGVGNSNALKLTPDKWHRPIVSIYCGGEKRRDFTPYDVIQFYFRSPVSDPGNPSFNLRTWDQGSNTVYVRDYIEDGIIDNTWRKVTVPLDVLKTSEWTLGNVEDLAWNKDEQNRAFYVDNIILRSTTALQLISSGEDAPFPESNQVLRLRFDKRYNESDVRDPANYTLYSSTDQAYADPQHPVDTGIHYRVTGFTESKTPIICWEAFLQFKDPFSNGREYSLTAQNIRDSSGNPMKTTDYLFRYDDLSLVNANIKVNQAGYLPQCPKIGYAGGFLGDRLGI